MQITKKAGFYPQCPRLAEDKQLKIAQILRLTAIFNSSPRATDGTWHPCPDQAVTVSIRQSSCRRYKASKRSAMAAKVSGSATARAA